MPIANITASFVAQVELPPKGKRVYYTDAKLPGFSLCVSSTGSKVFYWVGRSASGPTREKIEKYPKITVSQARELCVQIHADMLAGRVPPHRKTKSEKTIEEVWVWHRDNNLKPHNRTWTIAQRSYAFYVHGWGKLGISALTSTMIKEKASHLNENNGPGAANKFLSIIRGICRAAVSEGWAKTNPSEHVRKFKIRKRRRYVQENEVEAFFTALGTLKPERQDYFATCIFTGARRSNVCAMAWSDVDLKNATWTIPGDASKNDEPIHLPLSEVVMSIMRRRKESSSSPWVFPGRSLAGHYSEPKRQWKNLLIASGLENLRIHDLRRTLGSWQANAGTALTTIGQSLGHRDLSATLIYAQLHIKTVRDSVQSIADSIQKAAKPKKSENDEK